MNCTVCKSPMYRVVNPGSGDSMATCHGCSQYVQCAKCSNPRCEDVQCLPCHNRAMAGGMRPLVEGIPQDGDDL